MMKEAIKENKSKITLYLLSIISIVFFLFQTSCKDDRCLCKKDYQIITSNDSIINYATKEIVEEGCTSYERYFNQFDKSKLFLNRTEAYRLTINCSIANFAKTYELNVADSKPILLVQEFSKSFKGKRKIEVFSEKTIILSQHQLSTLQSTFEKNCFWTMQSEIDKDKNYLDGTQYGLEGVNGVNNCTNSKYHLVSRLGPDSSNFLNICEEFFKFDSLNIRNVKEW